MSDKQRKIYSTNKSRSEAGWKETFRIAEIKKPHPIIEALKDLFIGAAMWQLIALFVPVSVVGYAWLVTHGYVSDFWLMVSYRLAAALVTVIVIDQLTNLTTRETLIVILGVTVLFCFL